MHNIDKVIDISQRVRLLMKAKRISAEKIASDTKLTRYQIDNILYNRSKNFANLQKIASILDTTLEELTGNRFTILETDINSKMEIVKNCDINTPDYLKIVDCCRLVVEDFNLNLSHSFFEKLIYITYSYRKMARDPHELKSIIKGIMFCLMENFENIEIPN